MDGFKEANLTTIYQNSFLRQLSMAETLCCPQIQIASEKPIFLHGFCKR